MLRGFRVVSLSTLAAFLFALVGCGEPTVNSSENSQDLAKDAAAKMPPPPGIGGKSKKKR